MKLQLVLVLVALAGLCHAGSSMYSMAYTSEHTISPDFGNWLFNHGYGFNSYYAPDFLSLPIPISFNIIIYQNDGGSPVFDPAYKTNIEDWVTNGGTLLYYGRDSLNYADPLLLNMLGLTNRINVNEGDSLFDFAISGDSGCYALANGYRRDLRGVVPSQLYPYWVEDHLNLMTEVVPDISAGTLGCLPSSLNSGYHLWTVRPLGLGRIIFMSTSTYTAEEFYKPGFYAAAFLNAYYSALRGVIVGDPHVVTLAGQAFDMPIQSYNRYFNFFKSSDVNLNGFISPMLGIAPGLWVTKVGLEFTVDHIVHEFYAYIDEDLLFRFVLDDRELEVSESSDHWSFSLESSHVMIGAWHDKSHFLSTGVFSLVAEGGSVVIVQAVEWRDAPSFSIKVSESLQSRDRNIATGLLQHPLDSETRDVDEMFNVFIYEREALFP